MNGLFRRTALVAGLVLLFAGLLHAEPSAPLKDYVYQDDPAYAYRLIEERPGEAYDVYSLQLISQNWRSEEEVTPTLWQHWLTVIVPHQLSSTTANLTILGGGATDSPPSVESFDQLLPLATATGTIQVIISQVLGRPLKFKEQDQPLEEDALVAYSWRKSMQTGDPSWSAFLPMTKASVRAMDATQAFVADSLGLAVDDFIVNGFSKYGAIAWLTAAIDPRVVAVAPGVFNVLRLADQFERHYNSYGFYSDTLAVYEQNGILKNIRSPEGKLLQQLVDPISYKQALTMPHLLLSATGDEYFLPDASEAYIHDIPGETLQRIVPNTNHSVENRLEEMIQGLVAWNQMHLNGVARPVIEWQLSTTGELIVSSDQTPLVAKLWQANNPDGRDFRQQTLGDQAWRESIIDATQDGDYHVSVAKPETGWTAYLVELTYPGIAGIPQVYTTSVFVTPDEHPFEVEDPLDSPKAIYYWQEQLNQAMVGSPLEYDLATLQALLPFRVFGEYIRDIQTLSDYLNTPGPERNCIAARLSVAADQQGWYTTLYAYEDQNFKFWQIYDLAEHLYATDQPRLAGGVCQLLTRH
ncbi:MAG: PhoPQ-activated pathogenicity-related family protein [Candidatus Thiodiazotropha taylori]|nr:PhoPQ-activated pathogenicity-related family protein [Candidatus Thiodiazotropha taylori]MCG8050619.1 PhoPQ-activated pathogenicity-related family protein [Candidatus Thiodiazotropha taylori]MCG8055723.1 PhoPQ-activated pathogenicity-related family protein [Candidatus Thiodiazotropha taylori]MCW4312438.1 PhoPQ-activated pathogenicity-related family protein [Candidatus Thiodiazotropha taylori]MCW4317552.1 PhoPQ-activated pathogenicity-related family protein [Candidatus Thiodiazotropha taylori